jgi:outer membrane receptor protein involved in Fe transport
MSSRNFLRPFLSRPGRFAFLALFSALSVSPAWSQDSDQDDNDDDLDGFELSPFEVTTTGDVGYRSTNSTSGAGINMAIRDLPMPLDVLNNEFIGDLKATDLKETLDYSAGVFTETFRSNSSTVQSFNERSPSAVGNANDPFQNAISIRGYQVPNQQRMGFRVGGIVPAYGVVLGGNTDTITTERVEVVRGPQSLLYGINVLSGIVNMMPKKPLSEPAFRTSVSVGNEDFFRASFDGTGPIIKDVLSYRLMLSHQEEGDPIDFLESERSVGALQFELKLGSKTNFFVEYLRAEQKINGIGRRYLIDNGKGGSISNFDWRNEYGELFRFGYDDVTQDFTDERGGVWSDPLVRKPGETYDLAPRGENFNIGGPDAYRKREEEGILGLFTTSPFEGLSVELGAYYTRIEEEEFNADLRVFTNTRGSIQPNDRIRSRQTTNGWLQNPEVGDLAALQADPIGFVLGEGFLFPVQKASKPIGSVIEYVNFSAPDVGSDNYDRKFARYYWYRQPTTAETTQLRGRVLYEFETEKLRARHQFIAGYHFIEDNIDFVNGSLDANSDNYFYSPSTSPLRPEEGREAFDPIYFRESIFDFTPMRYNGEVLAIPGARSQAQLGGIPSSDLAVTRSGWKEAKLWYRGLYGVYVGRFFDERLTLITGVRRDSNQVRERERLMVVDSDRESDIWFGNDPVSLPGFVGYGDRPYQFRDDLPDSLNQKVADSIEAIRANQPGGTTRHLFDETQTFTTGTFGTSFRVTDDLSLYFLYSEGVFPNSGQRDGLDNAIGAEQTKSSEIGLKFELLENRLSGTVSVYQIKRKNAVYNWSGGAPAPARWHGGALGPANPNDRFVFSPQAAEAADSGYIENEYLPRVYGVAVSHVIEAFKEAGEPLPFSGSTVQEDDFKPYGSTTVETRGVLNAPIPINATYIMVPYETLVNDPDAAILKSAFDRAMNRELVTNGITGEMEPFLGDPIIWGGQDIYLNTPSEGNGANVLFEEEGIGIDGQLLFSPTPNYQVIFSFAHQQREIVGNGFTLVDAVDENGTNWGTEYDRWVYILGPENFEDPTRPSTYNGASVRGIDLSFVPQTSLRLWNKYTFVEGPLDGLYVGGGVRYNSSVKTSVPIGGATLSQNQYPTPDLPERYVFDALVGYRFSWGATDWSLSFKVDNLFDEVWGESVATYENPYGTEIKRRTRVRYDERFYRFSIDLSF